MKPYALIAALLLATPVVAEPAKLEGCEWFRQRLELPEHAGKFFFPWSAADKVEANPKQLALISYHYHLCGMPIYKSTGEVELWMGEEP